MKKFFKLKFIISYNVALVTVQQSDSVIDLYIVYIDTSAYSFPLELITRYWM